MALDFKSFWVFFQWYVLQQKTIPKFRWHVTDELWLVQSMWKISKNNFKRKVSGRRGGLCYIKANAQFGHSKNVNIWAKYPRPIIVVLHASILAHLRTIGKSCHQYYKIWNCWLFGILSKNNWLFGILAKNNSKSSLARRRILAGAKYVIQIHEQF